MPVTQAPPSSVGGIAPTPAPSSYSSPNATRANRVRGRQARTAANARARARGAGSPTVNARRARNLRQARAARNPVTAPRTPNTAAPSLPVPQGIPAGGAGAATSGAATTASIWTATPASAPVATAIAAPVALAGGLAIGNAIYEDVLGRPWGPSLGDYLFPREEPQRGGPAKAYSGAGVSTFTGGQDTGVVYLVTVTASAYQPSNDRQFGPRADSLAMYGPIVAVIPAKVDGGNSGATNLGFLVAGHGNPKSYNGFDEAYTRYFGYEYSSSARGYQPETTGLFKTSLASGGGLSDAIVTLEDVTITRIDGLPDTSGTRIAPPQEVPGSRPYRPSRVLPPAPASTPVAQPIPSPTANPSATPTVDPYPANRPQPNDNKLPLPALPLIPALASSPTATAMPTPATPPNSPPTPPSSKQNTRCRCNIGISQAIAANTNPIVQAQQLGQAQLVGQGASLATILQRLQQMQKFAETAWENSRLNKLINLLTLISVLHNAAMLSRDVGETIGDLTSNMLAAVGIKDETGSALDINELVGGSVRNFVQSVVGEEVYNDVSTRWKKASRIVSSAAMIAYTVRGLHDTSKDVMEWTAENTGKIGNALKRFGVVGERAYPWMSERVRSQDAYRRKFERVTEGLESLEDTASSLSQVTGNVREIQEEFNELQEQKTAFRELVTVTPPEDVTTAAPENVPIANTETTATADSQSADVAIADAQKSS